jgi:hypothetical protein
MSHASKSGVTQLDEGAEASAIECSADLRGMVTVIDELTQIGQTMIDLLNYN